MSAVKKNNNTIKIPHSPIISLEEFIAMPVQKRACTMAYITKVALEVIERTNTNVELRGKEELSVHEKAIRLLENKDFSGSFTLDYVAHSTDRKNRDSLALFEGRIHKTEKAIEEFTRDRRGALSHLEQTRDPKKNYAYTVFPEAGVVFRDRTLATMMINGVTVKFSKRTTAVYDSDELPGEISPKPLRRSNDLSLGTRLPSGADSDDGIEGIMEQVAYHNKQELSYANVLKLVLPRFIGSEEFLDKFPMYRGYDLYEHTTELQESLDFLDGAMIIAPRNKDPKLRKTKGLHVVDSVAYMSTLI